MFDNSPVTFEELVVILFVVFLGSAFLWYETGRDEALLSAAIIMLGIFAVAGAVAVVAT
jgi:hypothetical protein